MNRNRHTLIVAAALAGGIALAGCKKQEDAAVLPPPAVIEPSASPVPGLDQPAAAAVTVTGVSLGKDESVSSPTNTFAAGDTIYAAVNTQASDNAANAAGNLAAKWTHVDSNQIVNEESKSFSFTGPGTTTFHVSNPGGWPVGKYRLEVSLDGAIVNTTDFEVK